MISKEIRALAIAKLKGMIKLNWFVGLAEFVLGSVCIAWGLFSGDVIVCVGMTLIGSLGVFSAIYFNDECNNLSTKLLIIDEDYRDEFLERVLKK